MQLALIGLGKMGANMARRWRLAGVALAGYDRDLPTVHALAEESGMRAAASVEAAIAALTVRPRVVWAMVPAGAATCAVIDACADHLAAGDVIVDGGNSYYRDSERHALELAGRGIEFVDVGTSGGVWGLAEGYCQMVGASPAAYAVLKPLLEVLAPAGGLAHVGPPGAGHYTKMVHNGIEYGMMQAYAEGFALLHSKREYALDVAQIAELWRHGSVVRSWLLDLTAQALAADSELTDVAPYVSDSGEGRWTVQEGVTQGVPIPVLATALFMRFSSQDAQGYPYRLLAAMRHAFGGHAVGRPGGEGSRDA